MNLFVFVDGMGYAHWMMIAGGILVVLGFIGFAFRQNHQTRASFESGEDKGG
jgi:hypothetical protein